MGDYSTVSTYEYWYLSARSLDYGLYFVQYTVNTSENDQQIGYDYGFLKITPGPLFVYIDQGSTAVYVEKRNMTLNASATYDPDFFSQPGKLTYNLPTRWGGVAECSSSQLSKSPARGVDTKIKIIHIFFVILLFPFSIKDETGGQINK